MSTATRLYDLLIVRPSGTPTVPATLALSPGLTVTGAEKAAQRWVINLLTGYGSVPSDPGYGTGLLNAITSGQAQGDAGVQLAFKLAADTIATYENALPAKPDDETIVSATLNSLNIVGDSVSLFITLTTAAGESRVIIAPLPSVPD